MFSREGPNTFTGALVFRSGRADETLKSGGISHLVEHLAIHPFEALPYAINGFVDDTRTVFHATGTPAEVATFLNGIASNLANLPVDRLEDEMRVLRVEAHNSRLPSPAWSLRFGPRTYGLVGYPEFGLHWLRGDDVRDWAAERMTAANAALWFTGEPPAELDLSALPVGRRMPPPVPEPVGELDLPAWVASGDGGVSLSSVVERSTAAVSATGIFVESLQNELRRGLGLSYAAGSSYWRLTKGEAHVLAGADTAPEHGATVTDAFLRVLDELAGSGPSEEVLERYKALGRRYIDHPDGTARTLDSRAADELAGHPTLSAAQLREETEALTTEMIAGALSSFAEEAIYMLPPGVSAPASRAKRLRPGPGHEPVTGNKHKLRGGAITFGSAGITYDDGSDNTTIHWDECTLATLEGKTSLSIYDQWGDSIWLGFGSDGFRRVVVATLRRELPNEKRLDIDREAAQRYDQVMEVAATQLGHREGRPLVLLPRVMFDGEQLQALAVGELDSTGGLIAVTDRRLLMIDDAASRLLVELARTELDSAEVKKSMMRSKLIVQARGQQFQIALARSPQGPIGESLSS